MTLNGPALVAAELRLPGNLNVSFAYVEGEALLMNMQRHGPEFRQRLHVGQSRSPATCSAAWA